MSKLTIKQHLINPVLNKEFRLRMRTIRTPLSLLFYLLAIGLLAFGFIYMTVAGFHNGGGMPGFNPNSSRELFIFLSVAQLALIAFMTPGLTAGVISGEREKQTLNILLTTQQSSATIVISKLVSSLSFMLLTVLATLPVYSIVFLFGGISPGQLFYTFAFYIFTMFVLGTFGVLFSTLFKRTMVAVIVTYGVTLTVFGATGLLYMFLRNVTRETIANGTAMHSWVGYIAGLNPAAGLVSILTPDLSRQAFDVFRPNSTVVPSGPPIELWQECILVYSVLAVIALLLSIRYIRPVLKKKK
ncbi:ABC-type transport system involved in multi-copper enzyme maturation permease subunit [Paenibacillus mucilaginosus]|uniref:ABC transporter permease n=1 Tax=Paenibacillus mucilaginosus TaxID=61624 RepID=UPI003D19FDAA